MELELLLLPLTMVVLLCIHESGHLGAAKLLGLRVTHVGFLAKPIPHPYVAIRWSPVRWKVLVFFFAGVGLTLLQFGLLLLTTHFFHQPFIYFGFCVQLVLETNPFYSDFTLAKQFVGGKGRTSHEYSLQWYAHVLLWLLLIIGLFGRQYLYGYLF
ncbi:hypothetical protein SAMN02745146_3003 [Hymenobacter daecheongensis DSM 21074]|uniref:Peptidase family M50 n=1 Tax=Hymenobacter daecheongensis DSM 21074 TaxID=1121955 RepID=A0A1M6IX44_9BACT|nr:hypothetical protein [Hymenobacter daecheongensis]SHJ38987.1 hypothetical protein SAMN02745146_3003 [Hymenobacter daecheongensis DSM 21074]